MANVSDANGVFNFDEDFYKKNKALIDSYFESATLNSAYGITEAYGNGNGDFDFYADGRWSMENILPWALSPVNRDSKLARPVGQIKTVGEAYDQLFTLLSKENQAVEFDYEDYESGNMFRVHQTATIMPAVKPTEDNQFDVVSISSEDLPIDEASLITNDLEEGVLIDDEHDYPTIHDIIIKFVTFLNNDPNKKDYQIKPVREKFLNFIKNDPDYNGGFMLEHYDDDDELRDWFDDNLANEFA